MKHRLLAALLSAGLLLSLCACQGPDADPSGAPSASPSASASASADPSASPSAQEIVADLSQDLPTFSAGLAADETALTVNGQEVPADLFSYLLALNCANLEQAIYFYGLSGVSVESYADQLLQDSLNAAASYALLEQKAMEAGCPLTDEQRADIQEQMMANGQQAYDNQKQLFGLTDETMEFIFSVDSYYDNLLDSQTSDPTQAELEQYVSDNGIFGVKHILLMTVDPEGTPTVQEDGSYAYPALDEATVAEKKALAEDLLAQLQASDDMETLFDQLMEEYSEDGRNADGTLASPDGYVYDNTASLVDGFREATLELEPGELSGIVETAYGYHILLRLPVDPENYRDACRQSAFNALTAQWLEAAEVTPVQAVENLDVADFYARYNAWQSAMAEQLQAESADASASPDASAQPSSGDSGNS